MVRGAMANDNQKCAMQPMSLDAQRDRADSDHTPTTFRASGISMMIERQPRATFAEDGDMSSVSCGSSNGGGGATEEHVGDQRFQAPPPAYNGKPRSRKRRLLEGSIGGEALSPSVSTTASEETEQSEYGDSGQNEPVALQTAVPLNLIMTTGGRDVAVDQREEHLSEDENSDIMDMMDGDPNEQTQPLAASWSPPWWLQPRPDEYGDKPAQTAELLLVGGRLPPRPGAAQPARVIVPTPNGGVAVAQAVLLVLEPPVPTGGNPITDQQRQNRHRYKNHQRMQDNGTVSTQHNTMLGRNNTGNGHHYNYHCRVTPPRISAELADDDGSIDGVGFSKPAAVVSMDDPAAYVRQQQRQQMTSNAAAYYFQRQQQQQRLNGGGGVGLAQVSTDNDSGADNAAAAVAAATASTTMAALMPATAVHKHPTWPTTDSSGYFGGGNGQPQSHQQQYSTANGSHTAMMHPAAAAAAAKKRKRRTSFTPHALELLNGHFDRNTHPSGAEITALAARLGYDREVVRIWFCNKRQALKNAAATAVGIRSTGMSMLNGGGPLSAVKYYATTATP